jgi:hypothetical protein
MYAQLLIFVVIASGLLMAIYGSSLNFVSAVKVECFGGAKLDQYLCVTTKDDGTIEVQECIRNEEGISECTTLNPKPTPPGIEQSIQNGVKEETQANTNDTKDLGGMKTDKGTSMSPVK